MADARTKLSNEQKIAMAREAYARINRGDFSGQGWADNAVWHSLAFGDIRGKEQILATLRKVGEQVDSLTQEPHDILANDEHVVALLTLKASKKGKTFEQRVVQVAHINEDGKVQELWGTGGDPEEFRRFLQD